MQSYRINVLRKIYLFICNERFVKYLIALRENNKNIIMEMIRILRRTWSCLNLDQYQVLERLSIKRQKKSTTSWNKSLCVLDVRLLSRKVAQWIERNYDNSLHSLKMHIFLKRSIARTLFSSSFLLFLLCDLLPSLLKDKDLNALYKFWKER